MQTKMKGKIFNAQEVQAMIAGNAVMFREVINPQPDKIDTWDKPTRFVAITREKSYPLICPYKVGQKIFCKESFGTQVRNYAGGSGRHLVFKANNADAIDYTSACGKEFPVKWKPAQHMKQERSRLTLLIKEIRVERLGEISADDCWKEGIAYSPECCQNYIAIPDCNGNPTPSCCNNPNVVHPQPQFEQLWNATHKKPEEKFEASPFVWCVSFEVINN